MDPAHPVVDMSPLYVPRKRKSVQSHVKSGVPCPVVKRVPERACEGIAVGYNNKQTQDAVKMKRTYGRKRYEDLQNVSLGAVDYPTTSCSVMSSGGLANGADPGSMAPPTARLPPRLVGQEGQEGQEASRESGQPQDQSWNSGQDRGPDVWAPGRDRAQEQAWTSGRDREGHSGPDQAWNAVSDQGQDPSWNADRDLEKESAWGSNQDADLTWHNRDRGHVWRPDLNMKKVQRVEMEPGQDGGFSQPGDDGDSGSDIGSVGCVQSTNPEASMAQPSKEQKPAVLTAKREPPTYPAGSQEERWQLQIVAKGRVTCPKCKSVSRKTVEGLKKHMENCRLQPFTCQHCGKQLKSSTGMKYHVMADHSHLPSADDTKDLDDRTIKEKLRKVLKRLGKLKCSKEGCSAVFTSIMGYVYHMKKCGKEEAELQKMLLSCSHCGKTYRSKAGLEYHLKSEHVPAPQKGEEAEALTVQREGNPERTASGRVQRASAQVANFYLSEIANNDLPKDWPKRKFQSDLVPDDKKLKYTRPGLPAFSQEVLRKWKNEVKLQRKVQCPNQGCSSTYTSVSGLKAHLGLCTRGEFEAGKYRCLICNKEFNSESGVKYHINSVHSQDWFVTNKKASKKFEKFLKNQPREFSQQQMMDQYQHHLQHLHHHQQPLQPLHHLQHQVQPPPPEHHHALRPQQDDAHQSSPPVLQYTPLEPPPGPLWLDLDQRGTEQVVMEMDGVERDGAELPEGRRKGKGRRGRGGGGGGSSSESEAEQLEKHRHMEQWNLKRPGAMETLRAKHHRNT